MREVDFESDPPFSDAEIGDNIVFNHQGTQFVATITKVQRTSVSVRNPSGGSPEYWNVDRTAIRELLKE